jgi:hypothetical protein
MVCGGTLEANVSKAGSAIADAETRPRYAYRRNWPKRFTRLAYDVHNFVAAQQKMH